MKEDSRHPKTLKDYFGNVIKKNIVLVGLCWLILFSPENSFQNMKVEIGLSIVSVLLPIYCLVEIRRIKSAYFIHLLWFILLVPSTLLIFAISLRQLIYITGLDGLYLYSLISFGLALTIGFLVIVVRSVMGKLRHAFEENINSGRLNVKDGFWNLNKPLRLDSEKKEGRKLRLISRISKLSPVVVAIGFFIARNVDGVEQLALITFFCFLVGCSVLWTGAFELAISFQIREWERKYNIKLQFFS
ncbi:MAG: hypothetical protein IPL71_14220 [Anaerolineales bacterium]|uniref:hypothetical protein n=1 Tax=Candidatus Villigracilis proximus TaxID=3140683 RepID=UPI00313680C5|nr:hypothetical protein [Anaerolineales bacterium]